MPGCCWRPADDHRGRAAHSARRASGSAHAGSRERVRFGSSRSSRARIRSATLSPNPSRRPETRRRRPANHPLLIHDPTTPRWTSLRSDPSQGRGLAAADRRHARGIRRPAPADLAPDHVNRGRVELRRLAPTSYTCSAYLENSDPLAARIAWGELARAPYATLGRSRWIDTAVMEGLACGESEANAPPSSAWLRRE